MSDQNKISNIFRRRVPRSAAIRARGRPATDRELEAENAALARRGRRVPGRSRRPGGERIGFWVAVLLVLGMVLTPISILALFLRAEIGDTDRYVETVEPLSSDPAIQSYVADEITTQLFGESTSIRT